MQVNLNFMNRLSSAYLCFIVCICFLHFAQFPDFCRIKTKNEEEEDDDIENMK